MNQISQPNDMTPEAIQEVNNDYLSAVRRGTEEGLVRRRSWLKDSPGVITEAFKRAMSEGQQNGRLTPKNRELMLNAMSALPLFVDDFTADSLLASHRASSSPHMLTQEARSQLKNYR